MDQQSIATAPSKPLRSTITPADDAVEWIDNDGLLRDEGALFGLSGRMEGLAHKEASIRAYYGARIATGNRVRQALEAELDQVVSRTSALERDVEAAAGSAEDDTIGSIPARHLLGLAAATAACVFGWVLVLEMIAPAFRSPGAIALAVVAGGALLLFHPISLLFRADPPPATGAELWKQRITEFAPPVAAALFVGAWSDSRLGLLRIASAVAFLAIVFLCAGKLALSAVVPLGEALRDARARFTGTRARRARGEEARLQLSEAFRRAAEVRSLLANLPSDAEWEALCERKLRLFLSEVELASSPGTFSALSDNTSTSSSRNAPVMS